MRPISPYLHGRPILSVKSLVRRVRKVRHLLTRNEYRRGLRHGVAAAIEHDGPIRALEVGTLIDVGANIGQFSLLTRALHPRANIHAFEPLPAMADRYADLFADDERVKLHRIAAGEGEGTAEIHVSGRPDSSSLLPISNLQNKIFPGTAEVSLLSIPVRAIDLVMQDADLHGPILVKLDVQGFELAALKGMTGLLGRVAHIYVEVSFMELYVGQPLAHEIIDWLAGQGFHIAGVHNISLTDDGVSVQADVLFLRSEIL